MSSAHASDKAPFYPSELEDGGEYETIFVPAYRNKWGKLMIAAHYGLKAFPLRVRKRM